MLKLQNCKTAKLQNCKTAKLQNCKTNINRIFLYLFVLFPLLYGCKPKFQGEIKPEFLPKHNKTGVLTAKKWWQNQKTNPQNLQQKGANDSLFENYYELDWQNGESRISQKGKLQIRVPIVSKDSTKARPFVKIQNKDNTYHIGQSEMLFQLNPDSSFCTLLGITTIQDSTQLQKTRGNNFFTKTPDFTGSDFFFAFDSKKMVLKNDFVNGNYASKQDNSSGCYMYSHSIFMSPIPDLIARGGNQTIEIRVFVAVSCTINAGSGGGSSSWFGQIPIGAGTPSNGIAYGDIPPYSGGGDPFEPSMDDDISGINTNLIEGTIWGTAYNNLKRSQKFNTLISIFEDEPNNFVNGMTTVNNHRQLIFTLGNETTLDATHNLKATTSNQLNTLKCEIICDNTPPPPLFVTSHLHK